MSDLLSQITSAVSGTLKTVVIDSALLPGPVSIDLSNTTDASSSNGFATKLAKPSVTILDKDGTVVYQTAPWGDPTNDRLPFYIATAAAVFGLGVFSYGLYKLIKKQ